MKKGKQNKFSFKFKHWCSGNCVFCALADICSELALEKKIGLGKGDAISVKIDVFKNNLKK